MFAPLQSTNASRYGHHHHRHGQEQVGIVDSNVVLLQDILSPAYWASKKERPCCGDCGLKFSNLFRWRNHCRLVRHTFDIASCVTILNECDLVVWGSLLQEVCCAKGASHSTAGQSVREDMPPLFHHGRSQRNVIHDFLSEEPECHVAASDDPIHAKPETTVPTNRRFIHDQRQPGRLSNQRH
jgi:hypothetical protein